VRPGALPYLFPPGLDAELLLERLRDNRWWGQIVGPHGSGKSTLLATLLPHAQRAGKTPLLIALHDGHRSLPCPAWSGGDGDRLLVVDGYEQLSAWQRFWIRRRCRRHGHGLLATAHTDLGLPELFQTAVSGPAAVQIVKTFTRGYVTNVIPEDVVARLAIRGGNLREALFDLYDVHEAWRKTAGAGSCRPLT
jgi:hypothetical protein